jgi:hypothetical protein
MKTDYRLEVWEPTDACQEYYYWNDITDDYADPVSYWLSFHETARRITQVLPSEYIDQFK